MSSETALNNHVMSSMATQIVMPYTLTAGRAVGTFLAELANRRILGARCDSCGKVRVPAQDFCGDCGGPTDNFVVVPPTGTLEAWTITQQGVIALVLLDGAHVPLLHRLVNSDVDTLAVGMRVAAVWADKPAGEILDLAGFAPVDSAPATTAEPAGQVAKPIAQLDYTMKLDYDHAYGHYYGSLFDSIAYERRMRGVRCPKCRNVLVPPRPVCDMCFVPTENWVDLPDTGVVQGCSVVHLEFVGQRVPPPYVYAEIVLDGASTRLIHTVGGLTAEQARQGKVRPGSRVQAVWSERRTGSLSDIDYFEVIEASDDQT